MTREQSDPGLAVVRPRLSAPAGCCSPPTRPDRTRAAGQRSVGTLAVLVLAVLLLWAGPATAHTELSASSPRSGAVVAATTSEVVLTFSGRIEGDFSTVAVTGPDGADHGRGPLSVRDGRVVRALDGPLPAGDWELAYRVIAADGHPVTGTIPFSVAAPAAPPTPSPDAAVATPAVTPAATPQPTPSASPTPGSAPDLAPASDESPVSRALAPTAAVLALAAAGAVVLVRRSRRS